MSDPHDNEYVCEACGATFESKEARKRHVNTVGLVD